MFKKDKEKDRCWKTLLKSINSNWPGLTHRSARAKKRIYQLFNHSDKKTILFVIGCQRSGTTLMTDIFRKDYAANVYGERSKLSSLDAADKLRLNPFHSVKTEIAKDKAPLVVLKPLVESQNTLKLLDYFEHSKALWMYRDYKAVALSSLKRWGLRIGIDNLRPIVQNDQGNWRSENVSRQTRQIVVKQFSEDMNPFDAAALFWLVRNRLFFELNLDKHPDVMMCKYDEFVTRPSHVLRHIYRFVARPYPSDAIVVDVHAESVHKGQSVQLSAEVDQLCKETFDQLNAVYQSSYSRSIVNANN